MSQMPLFPRDPLMTSRMAGRGRLLAPLCAAMIAGCADPAVAPHVPAPPKDATTLFWRLENDHRAVNLSMAAPYDTLRIRAVPHDGAGRPLSLDGSLTFTSSEPARVRVSADGLIRAVAPGANVFVVSTLVADNVRHVDTTIVSVTASATPLKVARFSVQPVAPDSARWAVHHDWQTFVPGYTKMLPLRVEDATGARITGVAVRYTSSDPMLAPINATTGEIKSKRTGRAMFTAEATIHGKRWRDSVEFRFDWPVHAWAVAIDKAAPGAAPRIEFDPAIQRISKGGAVTFHNFSTSAIGITFDDPTNVVERQVLGCVIFPDQGGSGNIAPFGGGTPNLFLNCRSRRFPVPGVYTFRTTVGGGIGTIIVEDRDP